MFESRMARPPKSLPYLSRTRAQPHVVAGKLKDGGRRSFADHAYREIRRRIVDNEYPPAQQVLELDLARELGMSRTPVHEALIRLANERFVQIIPRHGMRVAPLSIADLRDTYDILGALEVIA